MRALLRPTGHTDEAIEAAKALINGCIVRWSEGANPHIRALIEEGLATSAGLRAASGARSAAGSLLS